MRFPEFTDEWQKKKLGDILQFKNGINAAKEQYGKGVKFVNVSDILNNEFLTYDNIMGSVDIDHTTHTRYLVEYGDILFQRSSETREEVGTANVYLDNDRTATFGGFVIRGKKIGDYNPTFFNNLLKTNSSRNSITSKSGGSTRYNVGQETLNSVELFFPQIPEQNKIASLLQLLNQRIQTQNKIIEDLETLMSNLRLQIFNKKLRLRIESHSSWEEYIISDILTIGNGKDHKHLQKGTIPVFGTGGIMRFVDGFLYDGETVCIGRKGTIDKPLYHSGKIWTVDTLFYTYNFKNCIPKFVFHLFKIINWLAYKEASGVPSLSKSTIEKIRIQIPSLNEQESIVAILGSIEEKIQVEQRVLKQFIQNKKYLLSQLFV
ncbi:restriction endonuclease subunit S [Chryseobacterium aurantiacum]|uniref:restriction endonuclease subunit S n=1 Tax=Chryseobacterium aurantiacum TaxID=2116499 RepID=UPI000D138F78|nr:restriction endonuclease subunit S [Chryseobacterium aurantiacum]